MLNVYKKLLGYVEDKKHLAYISAILACISNILLVASYFYFYKFLKELLVFNNIDNTKTYSLYVIGLMVLYGIVYFAGVWFSHILGFRLETNLRKKGIDGLMEASFAFYDTHPSGKIRKIIDDNASQTHMIIAHLIPDNVGVIVMPILMNGLLFSIDIRLGILMLTMTFIGFLNLKAMMGDTQLMENYMNSLERLNSETVEYVRGIQVVKIFRTEINSFKALYSAIMDYSKFAHQYSLTSRTAFVSFQVLFNLMIAFTLPIGSFLINKGQDSGIILTNIIFFATFSGIIFLTLMKVMYVGMNQYLGMDAVTRLEDLFLEMNKDKLSHGSTASFENYRIEFKDVSFRYEDKYILDKLSFELDENKTYALVGNSGSGKSTIAKLISGFYNIDSGQINIGDKNISSYSEEALMDNISFVFQHSKLFKKSIYENVRMGKKDASPEDVLKALSLANCDEILDRLPDREHTIIGSKGVYLSGGETQRIAIARAILKDSNIIILDEASAAADPENEYEIQKAFSNLIKNKTVIMIAHRLSSIKNVDEILVVDQGNIIQRGSHKDLIEIDGKYRTLQNLFSKANEWKVY